MVPFAYGCSRIPGHCPPPVGLEEPGSMFPFKVQGPGLLFLYNDTPLGLLYMERLA
jgi:hypothetical protein